MRYRIACDSELQCIAAGTEVFRVESVKVAASRTQRAVEAKIVIGISDQRRTFSDRLRVYDNIRRRYVGAQGIAQSQADQNGCATRRTGVLVV